MPDQPTPVAAPAAAPTPAAPAGTFNTVLPPGLVVESALDRQRNAIAQQTGDLPPDDGGAGARSLAAARQADLRGTDQPPAQPKPPGAQVDKPLLELRRPGNHQAGRKFDFNQVTTQRDQYRQQAEDLQRKVALLEAGGAQGSTNGQFDVTKLPADAIYKHPDIAKLKAERDTYYEEIKHVRVESDPEFRAKFDSKRDAAVRIAKSVSGQAGEDVARILGINDADARMAQLADRIKDFSEGSKLKIIAAAGQLAAIDVERDIEISTRKATWEHTQAARAQQQQAAFSDRVKQLDREFDATLSRWADPQAGMPFLVDDKVKQHVVPLARQVFSGEATATQLAEASLKAALFPQVLQGWQAALQELERLQAANGQYQAAWPGSDSYSNGYDQGAPASLPPVQTSGYDRYAGDALTAARAADQGKRGW